MLRADGAVRPGAASALLGCAPSACSLATLRAGDALLYDASVLHFGGANTVADNERVVFYFGAARAAAAAAAAPAPIPGREAVAPVHLSAFL